MPKLMNPNIPYMAERYTPTQLAERAFRAELRAEKAEREVQALQGRIRRLNNELEIVRNSYRRLQKEQEEVVERGTRRIQALRQELGELEMENELLREENSTIGESVDAGA